MASKRYSYRHLEHAAVNEQLDMLCKIQEKISQFADESRDPVTGRCNEAQASHRLALHLDGLINELMQQHAATA